VSLHLYASLIWALPVAGAAVTPLVARVGGRAREAAALLAAGASLALSILTCWAVIGEGPRRVSLEWFYMPGLGKVYYGLLLDPLSALMASLVAFISTLVFIYSVSYMRGDPGLTRYWVFMQLFLGGMELLVLSDNLIQMLIGWETVGVCSFALIAYWYVDDEAEYRVYWVGEPPEAYPPSHCGLKAFLVTRFGDTFMIAGMLLLLILTGRQTFSELLETAPPGGLAVPALLLMFIGAVGKSAQVPLMEWLPDAMAGPSSVSALIHAATMVKAGVYLTLRLGMIAAAWSGYADMSAFFRYVMFTGLATALLAALQASVASELKKVLAYSTASQIGYMMAALGAIEAYPSSVNSAFAHLVSHALFKAALFLAGGAVIHAAGSRFLRDCGGVGRYMRRTFIFFSLASLSLIGVPPMLGFWSKESILEVLYRTSMAAYMVALVTAAVTAFYTLRMLMLVFMGGRGRRAVNGHGVHEADYLMLAPYAALALLSLVLGVAGPALMEALGRLTCGEGRLYESDTALALASLSVIMAGGALAYISHGWGVGTRLNSRLHPLADLLRRRLYINAAYYRLVAYPTLGAAGLLNRLELMDIVVLQKLGVASFRISDVVRRINTGILNRDVTLWVIGGLLLALLLMLSS